MEKFKATANTKEFGLTKGVKYILENPKTGSVYVYSCKGKYLTYCRKDCFDDWRPVDVKLRK